MPSSHPEDHDAAEASRAADEARFRLAFQERLERDRAQGTLASLTEYLRRFPAFAEAVREEYLTCATEVSRGPVTSAPRGHPERVGSYRLLRELGRGGQGAVFEAVHEVLHRRVALKLLPPYVFGTEARERFRREAAITAKLDHPHIGAVHDTGEDGGVHFLAMRLVEGQSLSALCRGTDDAQAPRPAASQQPSRCCSRAASRRTSTTN